MADADDGLRRALRAAAPRPAPAGVRDAVAHKRRARELRRRAASGVLAVAVIAGSIGGFVALRRAFRADEPAPTPAAIGAVSNGAIAFSKTGREPGLFLVDPEGGREQRLTNGNDIHASWSPDGRRVVFVRSGEERSIRLHVLDLDDGAVEPITPVDMSVFRPAWSPDGSWIAFVGFRGVPTGLQQPVPSWIYLVRSDGTDLRRVTDDRFANPDAPTWSPDGRRILFAANLRDGGSGSERGRDVYVVDRDGAGLVNVTHTPEPDSSETPIGWLPNGNMLVALNPDVITTGGDVPMQIGSWIEMTPAGMTVRTVLEDPVNSPRRIQEPSLSPDGRFVVFDSAAGGEVQNIWTMDLATLERERVTSDGGFLGAWQPVLSDPEVPVRD